MTTTLPAPDWKQVWDGEKARIARRRRAHDIPDEPSSESATVGLALSGGGIRSATFSLGLMRALAQARVLESFDYLSSVSGGGYAGAFFNSLFARWKAPNPPLTAPELEAAEKARAKMPYDALRGPICRPGSGGADTGWPLWWLRSSGRYLAPTGAGDYVYAAALAVRNLLAIHYVLGLTLLMAAAVGIAFDSTLRSVPGVSVVGDLGNVPGGGFVLVATAMFLLWLVPLGLAYFATEMPKPGTAQAARADWWKSSTWRNTFLAGSGSLVLAALMSPPVAQWILSTTAARFIGEALGPLGLVYSGSVTLASVTAAIGAIVAFSLIFLGSAGEFVEQGRHMPEGAGNSGEKSPQGKMLATRVVLTKRLAAAMKVLLIMVAAAALLYVSHWLIVNEWWHIFAAAAGTGGTVLIALVKKLASSLAVPASAKKRVAIPFDLVALVLGFLLLAALAIGWTAFAWGAAASLSNTGVEHLERPIASLLGLLGLLLPLALITGVSFQFINLSSIQNLYSSRLVRAYLGASNPARSDGMDTRWIRISDTHPDDNLPLDRYYEPANVAPLHLINVTLNETVSPTDPLVQRDRHGRSLTMCPEFLCVDGVWSQRIEAQEIAAPPGPLRRVAAWVRDLFTWGRKPPPSSDGTESHADSPTASPRKDLPESMSLGSWIGISGAAFSTGIGRGTSIGKSLLLGIANVRLGHWWRSGDLEVAEGQTKTDRGLRYLAKKFRTQAYLVAELLGRFSGRYAPYWYLSDGGHFDNTGVYELLRRRVGVIVCSDNGADPSYSWDDLANLIRLARIDFGCEFEELSTSEIWAKSGLADLALAGDAKGRGKFKDARSLRIFWVTHAARGEAEATLLIVVKPRLVADAPVDVQQYAGTNDTFPQETTADQFFSEEQWESYRKLGETTGAYLGQAILSGTTGTPTQALRNLLKLRTTAARAPSNEPASTTQSPLNPTLGLKLGGPR